MLPRGGNEVSPEKGPGGRTAIGGKGRYFLVANGVKGKKKKHRCE